MLKLRSDVWMRSVPVLLAITLAFASGCTGDIGEDGKPGDPCSVKDNGDGTKTITCPGVDDVTLSDGKEGKEGKEGKGRQRR